MPNIQNISLKAHHHWEEKSICILIKKSPLWSPLAGLDFGSSKGETMALPGSLEFRVEGSLQQKWH